MKWGVEDHKQYEYGRMVKGEDKVGCTKSSLLGEEKTVPTSQLSSANTKTGTKCTEPLRSYRYHCDSYYGGRCVGQKICDPVAKQACKRISIDRLNCEYFLDEEMCSSIHSCYFGSPEFVGHGKIPKPELNTRETDLGFNDRVHKEHGGVVPDPEGTTDGIWDGLMDKLGVTEDEKILVINNHTDHVLPEFELRELYDPHHPEPTFEFTPDPEQEHYNEVNDANIREFELRELYDLSFATEHQAKLQATFMLGDDQNYNKHNTGIDTKKKNFDTFAELMRNQFSHGGEKYKLSEDKEFTDGICECFPGESGVDFILGTCMKYLGRYKNFGREKDILKVATYMYIMWLKGGFHLAETHDEDTNKDGA